MYIDTDTHYWPIRFIDRVQHPGKGHIELNGASATYYRDGDLIQTFTEGRWKLDQRLEVMDKDGFDLQVLIPDNKQLVYILEPELGKQMARAYNDTVAEDLQGHDRFLGIGWVYLPDAKEAALEARRAVKELGMKGIKLNGGYDNVELDNEILFPFYEEICDLDVPLLVHPAGRYSVAKPDNEWWIVGADRFPPYMGIAGLLGLPFSYMHAISRLIVSGTFDRFPNLRISFYEGGVGWVPFLMNHLNHHHSHEWRSAGAGDVVVKSLEGRAPLKRQPSEYFDNIYLASISFEYYLPEICKLWTNHNVMAASDYNHGDFFSTWPNTVKPIQDIPGLSAEDKEKILGGNAMRMFKMTDPASTKTPAMAI